MMKDQENFMKKLIFAGLLLLSGGGQVWALPIDLNGQYTFAGGVKCGRQCPQ